MMKRVLLTFVALALLTTTASALPILSDQLQESYVTQMTMSPGSYYAQTFTVGAGMSGYLDHVDLRWASSKALDTYASVMITTVTGNPNPKLKYRPPNITSAGILGDVTHLLPKRRVDWDSVDMSPENIYLTAGDMYAFVVEIVTPKLSAGAKTSGTKSAYQPGYMYLGSTKETKWTQQRGDFAFRTYMDLGERGGVVPEPCTLGLVGAGLAGLALRRRRKSRNK